VIVVGAGVAGLAAATALCAAGARVQVFEGRGVLGGRATSFVDQATGTLVDNGQHVVLGCYRQTIAYLTRIGALDGIVWQPRLEVPIVDRASRRTTLRCPAWRAPWQLLAGVLAWRALGWRDRASVLRLTPALHAARRIAAGARPMPPRLHAGTVADWLRHHGQTARLRELLWEPLALAALNQHLEHAAAAPFVRVLGEMFGPDARDATLGLPARPLSALFGDPARRFLEATGGVVTLHAPARLVVENGSVSGVDVRGTRVFASHVVAAIPWHAWRSFLREADARRSGLAAVRDAAVRRRASPIVTVNLWSDRPVLGSRFLGLPGRVFQWVFEQPVAVPNGDGGFHLSCVSSGAEEVVQTPDDDLVRVAWRDVCAALPATPDDSLRRATVVRERQATFSLAPAEPARPLTRTGVSGLWLAGDWIDTGLPATIESAACSGHRAAEAVLGRSTPDI
jgi:zeta-carotene desaturase